MWFWKRKRVEVGCFVTIRGDKSGQRWYVKSISPIHRALIFENAGASSGRWISVRQLKRVG